ncbi:imidazole glycerol phosphate synthase subunit HisH [Streptoalloteichus hindustanus]|uniref:imidazole glycerol phosphate synthase subunit HisH n=1 Tax=Streptoalloteichus hindustanus TaxID=2017 RepID=UPI00135665EF|nr:imidazole glycerol phosphate synthase subunit HisH [Streptoalloteichus hindustanus]
MIDYRTGNSQSVVHALSHLGIPNRLVAAPEEADGVGRVILPGVGAAGTTMRVLRSRGWPEWLAQRVLVERTPFLGICVGMQVLFEHSAEQDTECLGWLPGHVVPFVWSRTVRVPQMGWNRVRPRRRHAFVSEMPEGGYFYFVNSFYVVPNQNDDVAGRTEYGETFCSMTAHRNIVGCQFHVEKSGPLGLRLLVRFASLTSEELCSPPA